MGQKFDTHWIWICEWFFL